MATAPKSMGFFASSVFADIKGGNAKVEFRKTVVTRAITEALKNNPAQWIEAAALASGKKPIAMAYAAAFAAVGDLKRIDYAGKFDAPENAGIRELVATTTQATAAVFFAAFDAGMESAKAAAAALREATAALKAKAGADAQAAADAVAAANSAPIAAADALIAAGNARAVVPVVDELAAAAAAVARTVEMIRAGLLESTEIAALVNALGLAGVSVDATPAVAVDATPAVDDSPAAILAALAAPKSKRVRAAKMADPVSVPAGVMAALGETATA